MAIELDRRSFVGAAAVAAAALGTGAASAFAAESAAKDAKASAKEDGAVATKTYDVVVVGQGGAGMCAAIAAKEAGAEKVVILEKEEVEGGNTNFSSSGMNAAFTKYQQAAGIEDSVDLFVSDTITGGKNWNNVALVQQMCGGSAAGVDWVAAHGLELSDVTTMGGASVARCHRPADKKAIGTELVPALATACETAGVEVVKGSQAIKLTTDEETGAVNGVVALEEAGEVVYEAGAVILATGGFGANFDLIKEYRPDLADYVTTNKKSITGDGMVMAQDAGANLIQMSQIQTHPTVYQENGALIGEAVRGGGGILINAAGDRFFNEMGTRDAVSAAELQQPDGKVWVFYDQTLFDANKVCANYDSLGMSTKFDTLEDLEAALGVPAVELQATLDTYNAAVADGGASDPFGRTTGLVAPLETAPFYVIPVGPGIHHTMGGIYIDGDNQALSILGEKIPGLYAAGEVTGGIHGANRLGGNAVCDIVVMGINAGQKAAASLK